MSIKSDKLVKGSIYEKDYQNNIRHHSCGRNDSADELPRTLRLLSHVFSDAAKLYSGIAGCITSQTV